MVAGMRVCEFEQAVWKTDHLRLVVRAEPGEVVNNFDWKIAADQNTRLTNYLETRIAPRVGKLPYIVVDGYGKIPNGLTKLATLRQSYIR